jgi:hypothetical protein
MLSGKTFSRRVDEFLGRTVLKFLSSRTQGEYRKEPLRGYTFWQVFIFVPKFLVFVEYMGSTSNLAARQSGFWRIAFDLKLWQE